MFHFYCNRKNGKKNHFIILYFRVKNSHVKKISFHFPDEGGGLGDDEDHEKVSNTTYDPSQSSQSSSSSTPDAPFITSRTLEKMNLEMRSQGKKSLPRRRLKVRYF